MKIRKVSAALLALLLAAGFSACGGGGQRAYAITETYAVEAPSGAPVLLQVDLPVSYGCQQVGDVHIEGADTVDWTDGEHYTTAQIQLLGDGASRTVTLRYTVTLRGGAQTWDAPVTAADTRPAEFIDSDREAILAAAAPLVVQGDDYETAKNIHAFTVKKLEADPFTSINEDARTASQVLDEGVGVCGDYANVMVALLRAANIPARAIGGLSFRQLGRPADWSHPGGAHAWVEFYAGGAWHFADPTWGNRYFDAADTYHLSYGDAISDIRSARFARHVADMEAQGWRQAGGMVAPLHFMAWAHTDEVRVTPRAEVEKQ